MLCLSKQYCLELANQKNYPVAIENADKLARKNGAYLTDAYLEVLLDIINPIFEIVQKNCQQLVDQTNYSGAYTVWKKTSKAIQQMGYPQPDLNKFVTSGHLQIYTGPALKQIKNFITKDLVTRNSFERVCMEIDELKANDFRNDIIEEMVEVYYQNGDFKNAYSLLETYELTHKTILPACLFLT